MKRSQAAKLWTLIATAFAEGLRWLDTTPDTAGKSQLERTAELYESFLVDLPYEAADAAIRRLIATWMPTSANRYPPIPVVRAACLAQLAGRRRTGIEAWGDVRKLSGAYDESRLEELDPHVRTALETLGWVRWRDYYSAERGDHRKWTISSESENEASDRARFCELYDRLAAASTEDAIVGQLAPPLPQRIGSAPIAGILAPGGKA